MNEENVSNAVTEIETEEYEVISVVFRNAGKAYYFDPKDFDPKRGEAVIVETARGTEFAKVKMTRTRVPTSTLVLPLRPVIRIATEDDVERFIANCEQEKQAIRICKEKAAEHKLNIHLVNAEYTFDNRKLIFYFTSETRVDFRELVKTLAGIFRVRIELRQIGIRDEAKMLGGLGVCGRAFCCSGFLSDFVQVSIKMAKEQNFSLNSAKISGSCGRLMCCLRYEQDTYEAAIRELPSVGSLVRTPAGDGVVTEVRALSGILRIRYENEQPRLYSASEVTVLRRKGGEPVPSVTEDTEAAEPFDEAKPPEKPRDEGRHNHKHHRPKQNRPENGEKAQLPVRNGENQAGEERHKPRHHRRGGRGRHKNQGDKKPSGEGQA